MAAKYERVKVIGRGTFGTAWLAKSRISQRPYVLKEIRLVGITEKDRHQAVNEVAILAGLKHVNVVRYREAFIEAGMLNIAMEYADGGDLDELIKTRRRAGTFFTEDCVLGWFVQVCFALQHIHAKKILHRDLKPQNIFVTAQGIIKVGDFGIARMLRDTWDHAHTAIGTPYYMSPEICRRKPYNQKSDMWAAGCVLYEMTSLEHPFQSTDFSSLVMKITRGRYKAIPRHCGPLVEDLISVLLRVDSERRPGADQVLCIPGIQSHVLAYTDRCKTVDSHQASPTATAIHSGDKDHVHRQDLFKAALKGRAIYGDMTSATTRRHSVASSTGTDKRGGAIPVLRSPTAQRRRQSVGFGVKATTGLNVDNNSKKGINSEDSITKEARVKGALDACRKHRVLSTGGLMRKERPRTGNVALSVEVTNRFSSKQRSFSADIACRRKWSVSSQETNDGSSQLTSASSGWEDSLRKQVAIGLKSKFREGVFKSCEPEPTVSDNYRKKSSNFKAIERPLKKFTYVLESPSVFSPPPFENRPTRSSITKNDMKSETSTVTSKGSDNCKKLEVAKNEQKAVGFDDLLDNFVASNLNTKYLASTGGMELSREKGRAGREDCSVNVTSVEKVDAERAMTSDVNECLIRCSIQDGDSAREIRGKIETLRIYLEGKIGAETTVACLNLVGEFDCSRPDQNVLVRKIEEVLGGNKVYLPVLFHLHNLEQSCDWLQG